MAASRLWRQVGIEKIPRCQRIFEEADSAMRLWIDLWFPLVDAHRSPADEELIGQIYDYASWCWKESRNYDTRTAVACAFYEHLPLEPSVRRQVGKWLSAEEFDGLKEVFRYHLTAKEHAEFSREFHAQKDRLRRRGANLPS
jgi:hypothetical protein